MHEVCEAADLLGAICFAAWKRAELVEIDLLRTLRLQVGIKEQAVGLFVGGVAGDVLRAVAVKVQEGGLVGIVRGVSG